MNTEAEKIIQDRLRESADDEYRKFNMKLIPTLPADRFIGVRTPVMRAYAKEVAKSDYKDEFLASLPHQFFEENQVHGFVIELEKDRAKAMELLEEFLPYVDNWATSDMVVPKAFRKEPPDIDTIRHWMASDHTYTCRYGIGALMQFYLGERFRSEFLDMVAAVESDEYYVNMMRAWFFATALTKQYESTVPVIEQGTLDVWTHNKSIQKARESYRVTPEQKEYLKTLKK